MPPESAKQGHPILAWVCIVSGFVLLLVATGVISAGESQVNAPSWVIAVCGVVFTLAGCMILLGRHSRLNDVFAALVCFSFTAVGIWAAMFSPDEGFSNPLPILSRETNVLISRWGFGCGAILSFLIAVYAVRRAFRQNE